MTPQEFIEKFKKVQEENIADVVAVVDTDSAYPYLIKDVVYDEDAMTIWIEVEEY